MKIQIRSDNSAEISGYVNVVERMSKLLEDAGGKFIEVVKAKTFARALEKAESIGLMFNHQRDIGSTDSNLELKEDNVGLFARAIVTDPEVVEQARAGNLTGWSFGFYIKAEDVQETSDPDVQLRTLTDIDLVEVSILNVEPAYIATSVEVREGENTVQRRMSAEDAGEVVKDDYVQPPLNVETYKRKIELLKMKGALK